jgi:hypothetical protein
MGIAILFLLQQQQQQQQQQHQPSQPSSVLITSGFLIEISYKRLTFPMHETSPIHPILPAFITLLPMAK